MTLDNTDKHTGRSTFDDDHAVDIRLDDSGGDYYVYALSTVPAVGGVFDPDNIFYVGKGRGLRWLSHFREAQRDLAAGNTSRSRKQDRIAQLLESSSGDLDLEQYAFIVKGGLDEDSAFLVEALTIELLRKFGVDLTNVVAGHHAYALFKPAGEVRRYYSAQVLDVDRVLTVDNGAGWSIGDFLPGGARAEDDLVVVVKGSADVLDMFVDVETEDCDARFSGGVVVRAGEVVESGRRGWDPDDPWTDGEARERARHYWPVSVSTVATLQEIAREGRLRLALLVVDPRAGQSAVRYEWQVDPSGPVSYTHLTLPTNREV